MRTAIKGIKKCCKRYNYAKGGSYRCDQLTPVTCQVRNVSYQKSMT